jgi:6-phosphogluconolactonase (cycloisomerase 2 family)
MVTVFSQNLTTGTLSFVEVQQDGHGDVQGLASAYAVVISHDGSNLYTTAVSSDAVVVFDRNLTTGALICVELQSDAKSGVNGLSWPASVTISPDGRHIYLMGAYSLAVFGVSLPANADLSGSAYD